MHFEDEPLEHTKKRDTGHQSVSLENKTGDSTVLKIGNSGKVVIKQDMKGRRHKYGFNNNKREKAEKKRVVDDETGEKHQLDEVLRMPYHGFSTCLHSSSSSSFSSFSSSSSSSFGRIGFAVCCEADTQSLTKKLRTYLRIVARDKVDVTYENWKEVPTAQKDLIWEDFQAEFDIPEASDSRTKRKLLQTDVRMKAQAIQKQNTAPHVLSRGGYDYLEQKLLAEKTKKKLEAAAQSGSVDGVIDPPSPDSFEEQATQGSFVPHGRQDVLAAAIGRPEHPGRVCAAGAGVTIKQYFGSTP
ncbi:hypothetical protein HKD37_09G024850 [Glycine soja]